MQFILLRKVVITFESEDEIIKCEYSNETSSTILSSSILYYAVQGDSNV